MSVELAWGRPNERTPLDLTDVPIAIGDLPPALEGFRLAVVSDVHYGRLVDDAFVRHLAALVNGQAPDAIVIAGDFIDRSRRQFEGCVDLLRAFRAPAGVFGVLGNHEHRLGARRALEAYTAGGVDMLVNAHRVIGRDSAAITLAGLDDWIEGRSDPAGALAGSDSRRPVVVVSHCPDAAEALDGVARADLVVSRHTHGGQITLFGWPVMTQIRYRRYTRGLAVGPRGWVYTSRGAGVTRIPIRLGARAEVPMIRLTRGNEGCQTGRRPLS
ncbi:MAG: metallophosphoesterase [Planctomycetes bacterium]|nr:metallophosphoesterase [Planctomycetota bacterium]